MAQKLIPLCACLLASSPAAADQIFLKNGDRISGTIVSGADGKITVAPDFAPKTKIILTQSDIAGFTTEKPILLKLAGGRLVHEQVRQQTSGVLITAAAAPEQVPVAAIAQINPSTAWTGSIGVNGLYSRAATTNEQFGITADTTRRTDWDRITGSVAYFYGQQSTSGTTSVNANNWSVEGKYDYFFAKPWYGYADTKVQADHVNFLSLRILPGVGGGYQWIDHPDFHLATEAGVSYVYSEYSNGTPRQSNVAARLAYHVDRSWDGDRIKVFNDVAVFPTVTTIKDYLVQTDSGIRVQLLASMYSEVKAEVDYNNHPALGAKDLTTQLTLGVGLTY